MVESTTKDKEKHAMEQLILDVPTLYADHHVLKVREALVELEGIEELYVSSSWKQLMLSYDPKKIKPEKIEKTLTELGYPPGEGETPILVESSAIKRDPQWEDSGSRVTETNQADLKHVR
jgi:hypothetical protein